MTQQNILYIDGENFLHKVEDILKNAHLVRHKTDITRIDVSHLLTTSLKGYKIGRIIYYGSRTRIYKEYPEIIAKSKEVVNSQRILKQNLESQKVEFVMAGNVRPQEVTTCPNCQTKKIVFKEKGVDVRIAVDAISHAHYGELDTALLCSSDSDLQPVVAELQRQGRKVIYVGFQDKPNAGLVHKCDASILFRETEIIEAFKKANL